MLKLAVHALQADAGIDLKTDAVTDYIGDIDLSVQPRAWRKVISAGHELVTAC